MKLIYELKPGDKFRNFKEGETFTILDNCTYRDGFFYTDNRYRIFINTSPLTHVLIEESIEVETEEWAQRYSFNTLPVEREFRWNKGSSIAIKIEIRDKNWIYHKGWLFDNKAYSAEDTEQSKLNKSIWTLEKQKTTTKQWV